MQEGIKLYFREFKFKTVTLQDFIDCLKQALVKRMIQLDLQQWVDSWLTKSGVNEVHAWIEPKDGKFTLHVQQKYPRNGDQVYHEQIVDIALYYKEGEQRIISNVRI